MRKLSFFIALFSISSLCLVAQTGTTNYSNYIDPFIGTEGGGNVFPGTALPFSMVKLGPDCGNKYANAGWDANGNINGFSHVHVSGTGGGPKYGNILVMPVVGRLNINDYSSPRSNEKAEVGLYAVKLDKYNVSVRLSSTHSVGLHEYTFPKSEESNILIDAGSFLQHLECQQLVGSEVRIVSNKEIEGYSRVRGGWNMGGAYTVYFYAQFDTPASQMGTWKSDKLTPGSMSEFDSGEKTGAYFTFQTNHGQKVKVKLGISFLSMVKAKENLKELTSWSIDETKLNAEKEWNQILGVVDINDNNEENKKIFYTAMYHAFLQPTNRTGENPKWYSTEPYYDDFYAIWDTFRATNPLYNLLSPSLSRDIIRSLIDIYKYDGYMPDARSGNDNGRVQGGSDADMLIADALVKKLGGIDYNKAFEAMLKNAEVPPGGDERKEGRGGLTDYKTLGFVSTDYERAGSRTVEYANNDYAISVVAKSLGKADLYEKYKKRASNWENLWNPNIESFGAKGFIWPRFKDKTWESQDKFSTLKAGTWPNFFYESNSWELSLYVPQDVKKLIEKCGGKQAFESRLDTFFTHSLKNKNDKLGLFQVTNEPGFLTPNLYNYINKQDKTAALVRKILAKFYNTSRSGLPGNDDSGAMSSWCIFQALGFYPNTGQDVYLVSSPTFKEVTIHLENGNSLHLTAQNASPENIYIQSVKLNGKPLNQCWFKHTDIMNGGTLSFFMGNKPSGWSSSGQLPPSLSDENSDKNFKQ
jgi:predicted alpha-1,2-mannosidase